MILFHLPRSFRERSQLLFRHHRSTPRNRRTPERARTFFSISHFKSSDTKTKRNEKRAQLAKRIFFFVFRDRSDDAFGTISELQMHSSSSLKHRRDIKKPKDHHHHRGVVSFTSQRTTLQTSSILFYVGRLSHMGGGLSFFARIF